MNQPGQPPDPKPATPPAAAGLAAPAGAPTPAPAAPATNPSAQPTPATPARPHVVEFHQVTKTFNPGMKNEFTAIKDVTFTIEDLPKVGEFITLVGPSGCGKSTVLRLIAGLEPHHPATRGEVRVLGQPVLGPGADRGMVFQSYTSFDNRTVLDNIAFGLECQGMGRKGRYALARDFISQVGLNVNNDQYKYPQELSGGMRQRVAIARTLILRPRIILMDEPFGALDPITRLHMQDLLINLWKKVEATVFFVTHSIEEAVFLGDRCFVFSNSPGTILRELKLPRPDRPAAEIQRDPEFQKITSELRDVIEKLEEGRE